jgi:hypothetical protein
MSCVCETRGRFDAFRRPRPRGSRCCHARCRRTAGCPKVNADLRAQRFQREVANVSPIDQHAARLRIRAAAAGCRADLPPPDGPTIAHAPLHAEIDSVSRGRSCS